jgi:hypothetical protein
MESFMIWYSSPNIVWMIKSRRMRWVGHVAHAGKRRGACKVLVEKPEGKRPFGTHRHRWKNDTKMDLKEIEWEGMNWIHPAQDRDIRT